MSAPTDRALVEAGVAPSDDAPVRERALALVWFVLVGDWQRAEAACLSVLGTIRKRRAER